MKKLLHIFKNKWIYAILFITLIQQLLVAGGTYFLGAMTRQYPTQGFQITTALMLFICIFLPGTIVHYWIAWSTKRAYKAVQLNYLNKYFLANYNHPTHWRNEKSKEQRHAMMCKSGQETISSSINYFADLVATGLNIILNTISIILVTDLTLGIIIISAGIAGLSLIHFSGTKIAESSRQDILAENQLNSHLNRSWDNIILGNQLFFDRWKKHFRELFSQSEKTSLQTVKKKDWIISLASMITNGIVLGGALFLAWFYREREGYVLAILVMLPRSLQIVMHIQIIQSYLAEWKHLKERIIVTGESITTPNSIELTPLIRKESLIIKKENQQLSYFDFENILTSKKPGRYTITGPNGAGKSCLLLELKAKFNSHATYLPAQHQLILSENRTDLSTGETALSSLRDLQSKTCGILLLDEWDANLSAENREIVDKIIDQLSLERLVVEVRHFH